MATLLEQGITAAKNGQTAQARTLFQQVLLADDRNERAWLWMSEVADSPIEQIACIERALAINPDNKTTQLALDALKAQLTPQVEPATVSAESATTANRQPPTALAISPSTASPPIRTSSPRRPFRLGPETASNGQAVYHQHTVAMPAIAHSNGNVFAGPGQPTREPAPPIERVSFLEELEMVPLLPAVLFGTLTITAIAGVFLIIALAIFA